MHALVTGGAGFIGSHLTERLLRDRHSVTVLLKPGESMDNVKGLNVRAIYCDILDKDGLVQAFSGANIIYHLAARTDLEGTSLADYEVNTLGTANVVAAAEINSASRLVFYSSMLAVSLTGTLDPVDESFDAKPTTIYGQSKREGERIVARAKLPWTVIRPTLVFGPRELSTMRAFFRAVKSRHFMLIGSDVWQSFVYVKNLVEATYLASLHPEAQGEIFFVSDERPYSLAEFANSAANALGVRLNQTRLPKLLAMLVAHLLNSVKMLFDVEVPLTPSRVGTMTSHYVYSIDKAARVFGYCPPYNLEQSMGETATWYCDNHLL